MASISDRVGDLGSYLREQREHARLSVRQLAALAGVSNPYLSQVERGLRKPSAEVLQQIARGLRISAEALYVRAGILDDEGRPDVEAAVHADLDLTERQRRVLLDIYSSFRAENRRAAAPDGPDAEPTDEPRPAAVDEPAAPGAPEVDDAPRPEPKARVRRGTTRRAPRAATPPIEPAPDGAAPARRPRPRT